MSNISKSFSHSIFGFLDYFTIFVYIYRKFTVAAHRIDRSSNSSSSGNSVRSVSAPCMFMVLCVVRQFTTIFMAAIKNYSPLQCWSLALRTTLDPKSLLVNLVLIAIWTIYIYIPWITIFFFFLLLLCLIVSRLKLKQVSVLFVSLISAALSLRCISSPPLFLFLTHTHNGRYWCVHIQMKY